MFVRGRTSSCAVTARACRRASLARRLRHAASRERGDTLIEVIVSAALILVIATGVVTGLTVFGHESALQRQHSQADALAQLAETQLRGEQLSQLESLVAAGSTALPSVTQDGTVYSITNTANYVAAGGTNASCTSSSAGHADYIKTTTTVTWGSSDQLTLNPTSEHTVVEEGLIAAAAGSSLVAQVLDENSSPVSGITIDVVGTDPNTTGTNVSATTDSNGCAVFYGLTVGAYTITATGPTGSNYIDPTGNSSPTLDETLLSGQTTNANFTMARAGSITANFADLAANGTQTPVSSYGGNGSIAWMLSNPNMGPPTTVAQSALTASTLFPFTSQYSGYAGSCSSDDLAPTSVTLQPNTSATPALVLPMIYLATLTNPQTSTTTSTLAAIRLTNTGTGCNGAYPAQAANLTNSLSTTATTTESEPLPAGVYSACAQWAVASTGTTTSLSTSTSLSTHTTTTTSVSTTSTRQHNYDPWTTSTTTVTGTTTVTSTSTYTSTVTSTTTATATSTATNSVTNSITTNVTGSTTSSSAAATATLNQATAVSGTC